MYKCTVNSEIISIFENFHRLRFLLLRREEKYRNPRETEGESETFHQAK